MTCGPIPIPPTETTENVCSMVILSERYRQTERKRLAKVLFKV